MRNWFIKLSVITLVMAAMAVSAFAASDALNATSEDGILVFESDDGMQKWWFDARVYLDMAKYFDDGPLYVPAEDKADDVAKLGGGAIVRRARFALKSQLWGDWYSEIDLDFAEEAIALKDAYISYRGFCGGEGRIRVGNFRQPFGLEEVTTSRNLMFMERSQGTEPFVVGRRMGLEVTRWWSQFRASASVFGADVEDYAKECNETVSFAARVNYAPIQTEESTLLIGASGSLRNPDFDGTSAKFNSRPESNVSDTKFIYAKVKDVDSWSLFGGEAAYVNKRFMAQGEYITTTIKRLDELDNVSFGGGYLFVSYFLTDDTRKYDHKDAEFARVTPNSEKGAWEVAARFSTVDLNDGDVNKYGSSKSFTLGVNYYPNPNIKLMLNYGNVDNDEYAIGKDGDFTPDYDFSYVQMRFQTAF